MTRAPEQLSMENFARMSAVLSGCEKYRYRLSRAWGPGRRLIWIMLNPSTADHKQDDPTIRRCIGFARRWGYDGIEVVNLFAFRTSSPAELKCKWLLGENIDGPGNVNAATIMEAVKGADVVCAWGAHGMARAVGRHFVLPKVRELALRVDHLGLTSDGSPRHPLYLAATTERVSWTNAHRGD